MLTSRRGLREKAAPLFCKTPVIDLIFRLVRSRMTKPYPDVTLRRVFAVGSEKSGPDGQ